MAYPILSLKKGREKALERMHPWIFSGAFTKNNSSIKDGDPVWVADYQGNIVATGHFSKASIMVRVLSFDQATIDLDFFTKKIQDAFDFRQNSLQFPNSQTNAFRLIAGEGDFLSGLIIDFYNYHFVVQCHTQGMLAQKNLISEALQNVFGKKLQTIFLKSIHIKDHEYESEFLLGESPETEIIENGVKFKVNWTEGQKTGFFLDQRDNREILKSFSKGKKVLNTFCYTGGFSAYALEGDAEKVVSVDISESAINMTDLNAGLNSNHERHESITANVLQYLKEIENGAYDIIVLDPPAFAKNRNKTHNAIQAYKRINRIAMRRIKSGGLIFTFSCSQVIGRELFDNTVRSAAIEAGRKVRVIKHLNQSADHVINAFHQEGHYLKGLILQVTD